jgi:hypothetical protein
MTESLARSSHRHRKRISDSLGRFIRTFATWRKAARRSSGTFSSEYDDLGLYTLVGVVAEFVSPEEPTLVTEAAWDAGRAPSGHSDAPSARAICARLADRKGKSFPWPELLELVFDPARSITQTHAQRRADDADHFTEDHVYYALRLVARERKAKTLAPDAYARARQELIARDRRRGVHLLADLLPTVGQIERVAGSWAAALEFVGLEVRNGHSWKGERGMAIVEALDLHAEATGGWLCNYTALDAFASRYGFALSRREVGKSWTAYLEEATVLREARGAKTKGLPKADTKLEYKLPAGQAGEFPPRQRGPGFWTKGLCVEAAKRYLDELPAGKAASKKGYLAWSTGRDDAPAPSTFDQHGGYEEVMRLARSSAPIEHVPTKDEEIEAAVLSYLDEHGRINNKAVQGLLGVKPDVARRTLGRLRDRGIIELGSAAATGRGVYYLRA